MASVKMHADELDIDASVVRTLLADQYPEWAELQIEPVRSAGTDNAIFRLGSDKAVRMPRIAWAVEQVAKEQRWLPYLAPYLPLEVPAPLAKGKPGLGYLWGWSVYSWLEGENATVDRISDPFQAAADLAEFISALHRIDTMDGPPPGSHNSGRGVPLAERDEAVRTAMVNIDGIFDTKAVSEAWDSALSAPRWDRPPVWIHGDLQSGNLLAVNGRLSAVIDFGCLGVGDPACDVMTAWLFLPAETRSGFRQALGVDEATWARARGWALSVGLIALPYYHTTNPILAEIARRAIHEVLADADSEV